LLGLPKPFFKVPYFTSHSNSTYMTLINMWRPKQYSLSIVIIVFEMLPLSLSQRRQNCLPKDLSRFTRSMSLLKCLPWLPVRFRIIFTISTVTYQVFSCKQYLRSLLTPVRKPIQL